MPCLLFFTRVDAPPLVRAPSGSAPAIPGSPVKPPHPLAPLVSSVRASPIDEALFSQLMEETRQKQWRSFVPFDVPKELPRPVSAWCFLNQEGTTISGPLCYWCCHHSRS